MAKQLSKIGPATRKIATLVGVALGLVAIPSSAVAQSEGTVSYRMVAGDTLISVQERFLLGRGAHERVARLNRIANVRRIPVGTVIEIPRELLAYQPARLTVRNFSGPVTIDGVTARSGQLLTEDSVVRTGQGGFVTFEAVDGGSVSLPSNSRAQLVTSRIYALRRLRDVEFRILNGRGEVIAPTLGEDERWRTSTPVAVTAVRGTNYRVGYSEEADLSVTEVVEGSVNVSSGEVAAQTDAGFGISASSEGLGQPEELLPPALIANPGALQTDEIVTFAVTTPPGATAVRTEIATDAGFLELVASDISGTEPSFTDLEDGRYFVRARGVSASGLEGLSEAETFRRKLLTSEGFVESSPIDDGFRFAWSGEGEGITFYAFQLWREGESASPLFDEIALPGSATVVTGLDEGGYVWRIAVVQADAEDGLLKIWGPEQILNVSAE